MPDVEEPWHFVGDAFSPCPFIVTVDYGVMAAPLLGGGGRVYAVWLFGYKQMVHDQLIWSS